MSRLTLSTATPDAFAAMRALDASSRVLGPDPTIRELVKIRASQINGCIYCIDLHTGEARRAGETDRRMHALAAWRESDSFDARERSALELCEAMTLIADSHVPDDVYREAERMFDPDELAGLIWTIVTINAWNRVATTTRMRPKP